MNQYSDNEFSEPVPSDPTEGQNTMAVLNTIGGGEDALAEGEPLGLDPGADKAKISGSSLAVGVVVVLGAVALFGMRLTLGAIASGDNPIEDIAQIEGFLATQAAAQQTGNDGPIKAPTDESRRVIDELNVDPTDNQVPAEEVKTNPFDLSQIVAKAKPDTPNDTDPQGNEKTIAMKRAMQEKSKLKVDSISGQMAFINGDLYRVGEKIGNSGFVLESIEGLKCKIRTTDEYRFLMVLEYQ